MKDQLEPAAARPRGTPRPSTESDSGILLLGRGNFAVTTFCCGEEGKKAVHSIPREPLWQVLAGIGGVGPLVQGLSQAVQGTYADSMQTCMKTVLASLRKMAARSCAHAQQVSDRVAQPVLSCLAYILMHLWATW